MEAGKERLTRNTVRDATRHEIEQLKRENGDLKEIVADLLIETHRLKKTAMPSIVGTLRNTQLAQYLPLSMVKNICLISASEYSIVCAWLPFTLIPPKGLRHVSETAQVSPTNLK
jgi:hypothetical protein